MTNTINWLWQFDETKDSFEKIFLHHGLDTEWSRLLAARKRNQIKRMKDIMRQAICDMPKPSENTTGWESLVSLLED